MASFQTVCLTIDPGVHQQLIPVQRSWLLRLLVSPVFNICAFFAALDSICLAVCPGSTWLFVLVLPGCLSWFCLVVCPGGAWLFVLVVPGCLSCFCLTVLGGSLSASGWT